MDSKSKANRVISISKTHKDITIKANSTCRGSSRFLPITCTISTRIRDSITSLTNRTTNKI